MEIVVAIFFGAVIGGAILLALAIFAYKALKGRRSSS